MANWVRITDGSIHEGGYVNLDSVWRVCVIPTLADSTKFAVVVYETHESGFETVLMGPSTGYASINDALVALKELLSTTSVLEP